VIVEDQSKVIAFLSQAASYPKTEGEPRLIAVERIETHISVLFLAGHRAYKLKRAVRLPYLDFSTAGLRRRYCEREVEINQRTAPALYHSVVPVVRTPSGGLAIGGEGEAVDWLVKMTGFPQEAMFDRLAAAGRLDRFVVEVLADVVAGFHAAAEIHPNAGGHEALKRVVDGNRQSFGEFADAIADPARIEALMQRTGAALDALAPLLERRRQEGRVRHCHGDLHLRNIVAFGGRPVLFDAIEFSDALAEIDVLYDLAFLVMDLDFRGFRGLASTLLNRYLDNTGDSGGLAALPLFLSLRAAIRSHVAAAAAASHADPAAIERDRAEAGRYLDLAARFLQPVPPRLIAIGGLSGSGKSRLARDLAPLIGNAPGARVIRTDTTRKRLSGVTMTTRLGATSYNQDMNRRTYEAVEREAATALAAGQAVIADAVFARPDERAAIEAVATRAGVPFDALWLETSPHLLEERVSRRRLNPSDATPEVVRMQMTYDLGPLTWPHLDSSDSEADTLAAACTILGINQD
jgi:Uncharacterized protein conserved in bacteria